MNMTLFKRSSWKITPVLVLFLSACGADGPVLFEEDTPQRINIVPSVVNKSAVLKRVDSDAAIEIRIALDVENEGLLDAFLAREGRYNAHASAMAPDIFALTHHPSQIRVDALRRYLLGFHLDVDDQTHGFLLGARGRAADIESALSTELHTLLAPDGCEYSAPTLPAHLPPSLHVVAVHGLSSGLPVRAMNQMRPASSHPEPGVSRASQTALSAAAVRQAYNIPDVAAGLSPKIGLLQLDGFNPNDIAGYARQQSLTVPTITTLLIDGAKQTAQNSSYQGEVTADIEMVMAALPKVAEIRLYQGPTTSTDSQLTDIYNEMANPSLGDRALFFALSTSYGQFEDQLSPATLESQAKIFKQMAAQGQAFFSAAGDTGAYADGQNLTVINPAIQPYVTGVGGTRLTFAQSKYVSESAWAQGGGGISNHFALPSFQSPSVGAGAPSSAWRNSPDVALNADPNTPFAVYFKGANYLFGGTSLGAPIWASIVGLAQAEREAHGQTDLGFFNATLYQLMRQGLAASAMHDITTGDNGYYHATSGFDATTGWGTPDAQALINALVYAQMPQTISKPGWPLD